MDSAFSKWRGFFIITSVCTLVAAETALTNITITVAEGTTNHRDPRLLCRPTRWTDIMVFYLGNYIVHAATTTSLPGESPCDRLVAICCALLFPSSSVVRAMNAILSHPVSGKHDLETAARAGALCTVIRNANAGTHSRPLPTSPYVSGYSGGAEISRHSSEGTKPVVNWIGGRRLHGYCEYSDNYRLMVVPPDAQFNHSGENENRWRMVEGKLACNYNLVKPLVALIQTLYGASTLYRARGNQIETFGYASFGLTVVPYVVMSAVNLIASLLSPEYPTMFLVESHDMIEARRDGYQYHGVVGVLSENIYRQPNNVNLGIQMGHVPFDTERDAVNRPDVYPDSMPAPGEANSNQQNMPAEEVHGSALEPNNGRLTRTSSQNLPVGSNGPVADLEHGEAARQRESLRAPPEDVELVGVPTKTQPHLIDTISHYSTYVFGAVSIAVIGGLTHFDKGSSTHAQRVWTMMWLSFGIFFGQIGIPSHVLSGDGSVLLMFLGSLFYSAPAIGGFVVVGQMLNSYGVCVQIR